MDPVDALSLEPRQVDLWFVLLDKLESPALLDSYQALLSADELAREQRFHAPKARLEYLVGRALVRTVLSRYVAVRPEAWEFSYNPHGKPSVAGPGEPGLEFNLSHTEGVVVLAVSAGMEIGVDVESRCRRSNALELARRFFAAPEAAVLEAAPPDELHERFFEFWTLKEAFIKARGTGLVMPLERFAFTLAPGRAPRITFFGVDDERTDQWQFAQLQLAPNYQIGLAVRLPESEHLTIRIWETVPLAGQTEGRRLPDREDHRWVLTATDGFGPQRDSAK
jgi:4'-phosphopantetheinyl transferase